MRASKKLSLAVNCVTTSLLVVSACAQSDGPKKLEFEVASVRENKTDAKPYSNVPLGAGPQYSENGGHFISTNMVLMGYIVFAYKPNMFQLQQMRSKLPEWTRSAHYDIQARVEGRPSKDEMRVMMQGLLAERFKMTTHHEMRETDVYAVVLAKPGKLGPLLKPHPADDPDCTKAPLPESAGGGAYPAACGAASSTPAKNAGSLAAGGHNVSPETLAFAISGVGDIVDRPVIDRTGLTGTYDFNLEYAPAPKVDPAATPDLMSNPGGPTLTDALKTQLGLKLVPQKGMVDVIVIDHVEKPSEN
jgi:uncharacterized protein (TIGR03435 family)